MIWLPKGHKKRHILVHLLLMLLVFLLLVYVFFYLYLPYSTRHGETIDVPDLKDKTLAEGQLLLEEQSLQFHITDSIYIEGAKPRIIMKQNPEAGSKVKENRKIYLSITASQPPMLEIPAIAHDQEVGEAESQLKNLGLKVSIHKIPGEHNGLVVKKTYNGQEIQPGQKLPKGAMVTLVVEEYKGDDQKDETMSKNLPR